VPLSGLLKYVPPLKETEVVNSEVLLIAYDDASKYFRSFEKQICLGAEDPHPSSYLSANQASFK
jgi:hypothetical protein